MQILQELTQLWGVAGREKRVRAYIEKIVLPIADEVFTDPLGNLIVLKKGNGTGKKIMLASHMDEIGFQVNKIESDGRIMVNKVGFVWTSSIYNDKVIFENGTIGIVGALGNIEDAKNDSNKLFIDIGCTSNEETLKYVNIGDYCGFIGAYHELATDCICAKSMDDRVGCYILIEALKKNTGSFPNDVYYVFTVQEEIGCRGALVAAERIKPDIGISIDVTPDTFYPCDLHGCAAVGDGVGVKLGDPSAMLDEYLVDEMLLCCNEHSIKYQRDVMERGGTDASSINRAGYGVRVAGISVVTRYPHAQSALVSKNDIASAIELCHNYTQRSFSF